MNDQILKNGFCVKHNKHFSECHECYEKFQKQEVKKWDKKQTIIKQAYQNQKSLNNYFAMTSGLIDID